MKAPAAKGPVRKGVQAAPKNATASLAAAGLAAAPKLPAGPSSHELAVGAFEKGFQALQARQFGQAAKLLAAVVNDYPDEKELQERARVYLNICERQAAGERRHPQSLEERINEATVALNRGETATGLALLRKLENERGDHDHVQYMLSVACTLLGDLPQALEHLKHAVALNHENRYLATQDADLDPLRQEPGFAAVLDTPSRARSLGRKR